MTDLSYQYPRPVDQSVMRPKDHEDRISRLERLMSEAIVPSGRNLFDNAQAAISQRGASGAAISNGTCLPDRWAHFRTTGSVWTQSQNFDRPGPFIACVDMTCTTGAAPTAGQWTILTQRIEGIRAWPLGFGFAWRQPVVLSFWVKSNVTGLRNAELLADGGGSQSRISKAYTINSADTWERKVITFPANSLNVVDYIQNVGLTIHFWIQAGTDFTGGTQRNEDWVVTGAGNNNRRAYQQVNMNSTGNYIRFTGLQLEIGVQPTQFEQLVYNVDERQCYRYLQRWTQAPLRGAVGLPISAAAARMAMALPVYMRGAPAAAFNGLVHIWDGQFDVTVNSVNANYSTPRHVELDLAVSSAWAAGTQGRVLSMYQNGTGYMDLLAEI